MSLDVFLYMGENRVFSSNITHNLNKMAEAEDIYECLWRPDEYGFVYASQIIEPLSKGLARLVTEKAFFEKFNSPNGWGSWRNLVLWGAEYLQACRDNQEALVRVSR